MDQDLKWYLPSSESAQADGPFTTREVVQKLQSKILQWDHFIWAPHFDHLKWKRIYQCEEFKSYLQDYPRCHIPKMLVKKANAATVIKLDYKEDLKTLQKDNELRRYPRAPLTAKVIIHNQTCYQFGESIDISEKGMYLQILSEDKFKRGEEITVTITHHSTLAPITFKGAIINLRHLEQGWVGIGVYFIAISPLVKRKVARYVIETIHRHQKEDKAA